MRLIIYFLSIHLMVLLHAMPLISDAHEFMITPKVELGDLEPGNYVEFTITVTSFHENQRGYGVSIFNQPHAAPWITNIEPSFFLLSGYWQEQEITISGVYPQGWYGRDSFYVDVQDGNGDKQSVIVWYNGIEPGGVGDWISLEYYDTYFNEGESLFYSAEFYDFDGDDDYIVEWNLQIKLLSDQGDFIYQDITNSCCGSYSDWYLTAPELPADRSFTRNAQGQVYGMLTVSGKDNDGVVHKDYLEIGIFKEPGKPLLFQNPASNSSVDLLFKSNGGTNYFIYYDDNPEPPYLGTGLPQGNSPIEIGNQTTFELLGLQECNTYYIAVKASNDIGTSDYSVERSILLFEAPDGEPVSYHFADSYITSNMQLNGNHFYMGDLIIKSGANLTFLGGTVIFDENSKLIIESGAKLTVDGSTLTGACGQTWHGIEVWGDNSVAQLPDLEGNFTQGFLDLKNGALVENTTHGIELWHPGYWGTTGGIIKANNSTFRNNGKPIRALNYDNFNYFATFRDCIFEITADYHGETTFYRHVDLASVKGVRFEGCDFSLDGSATNISPWNSAIMATNANFNALAICTSGSVPCSAWDFNTFDGFYRGISASGTGSINTFAVIRAIFTNNTIGVYASGVNNFSVLFSEFYIGANSADTDDCEGRDRWASGFGISTTSGNGFAIEENRFYKAVGAPPGTYTGIFVAETNAIDEIYLNEFENLSYGIYTEGKNWEVNSFQHGLSLLCNQFTGSYRDIVVEKNPDDEGGIQSSQGSAARPAGNDFVNNIGDYKIYNNGNYPILYYYDLNSGTANPNPSYEVGSIATGNSNGCPSHYGGGGVGGIETIILSDAEKLVVEQNYLTEMNNYNSVKTMYENLQDGGDTEGLKAEVETAWPDDTWELRAELLGKSPHLSTEVLKAAADKTDVLPESIIFEIMAANPDELRKEELIKYLEDKENPLPQYMIDILRQVAYGTTYKTALQNQMAAHNRLKTRAANDMIRSILNEEETDYDALRNWLDNLGGVRADQQIVETYLAEGNVTDASGLAEMISDLYQLSDYDLNEHVWYMEMLDLRIDLLQQGRSYDELTGDEVAQLENLAQNSHGTAGAQARAILEQGYGHHFCDCLNITDNQGFKSTAINPALLNQALGVRLTVDPNPAREWAAFDYTLPENTGEAVIKITDATGQVVKVVEVTGTQGQYVWDTRKVKPGVYFYTLLVNGTGTTSKLVITK